MMTNKEIRDMIEDVANLTAVQIVRPIEQRLSSIEAKIECRAENAEAKIALKWKIIGFGLAFPGFVGAALSIFKIL